MDSIAYASLTHVHLLNLIHTHLDSLAGADTIRILDAGCGNGKLIGYLQKSLRALHPGKDIEVYGFDVADHGVQNGGFFEKTCSSLYTDLPDIDWSKRLFLIQQGEAWPFADGFFSIVLSNQVLEHVRDMSLFVQNVKRSLRDGGMSFHLFPLKNYIYEGHLFIPYAHRIGDYQALASYLRFMSRLGIGKYRREGKAEGVYKWCERHADYLYFQTHYREAADFMLLGKEHGMRCGFEYTRHFYTLKLWQLLGRKSLVMKYQTRFKLLSPLMRRLFAKLSSVTLTYTKMDTYR